MSSKYICHLQSMQCAQFAKATSVNVMSSVVDEIVALDFFPPMIVSCDQKLRMSNVQVQT